MKEKRYVILDRDGTIIEKLHYLLDPEQVALLPGVGEALFRLRSLGLGMVIITNQSPVGRGLLSVDRLASIHERMKKLLNEFGVQPEGIFVCPHVPGDGCSCRKPRTGLVDIAARQLLFDPSRAFIIGDSISDMILGKAVCGTTFLVRTGNGKEAEKAGHYVATYVVDDLVQAAAQIEQIILPVSKNSMGDGQDVDRVFGPANQ